MNGTVALSSRSAMAAATCGTRTLSSAAMRWGMDGMESRRRLYQPCLSDRLRVAARLGGHPRTYATRLDPTTRCQTLRKKPSTPLDAPEGAGGACSRFGLCAGGYNLAHSRRQ